MAIEMKTVSSGYSTGIINDNFQTLETALNNNFLRRDGVSAGEANQLELDLDANSNNILNVGIIQAQDISIDGSDATGILERAETAAEKAQDQKEYAEEWAQSSDPVSVEAGGDGLTDHSSKFWAEEAQATFDAFDSSSVLPSSRRFAVGGGVQSVDLGNVQLHPDAIRVFIDGVYQFTTSWNLIDGVLSPISDTWPGDGITENMEVLVDSTVALSFNIPSNGSVTTQKILDGAVTSEKLDPTVFDPLEEIREFVTSARQVPAGLLNARYLQLPEYSIKLLSQEKNIYNAFPGGVSKFGDSVVAIYSSGAGHGNSDRQRWLKSDNSFRTFTTGTFLENSTGAYDNSFLGGLLEEGESTNFKSVFTVKNIGGTLQNFTTSVVTVTDPYALWGAPVFIGDRWYTTGYRTSGGYRRPALFESIDGMETWSFVVLIATEGALELSEASLAECSNGDWIAAIREDSSVTRDLYLARSTDAGQTWGTPTILPSNIKGTQPHLLTLSNGNILLFAGDRTGSSGLDDAGNHTDNDNITGIACWKSTDNGLTWSATTMLAPSWSTDCGQPLATELPNGNVGTMVYLAPAATNGTLGIETGIYWIEFDPSAI